jgi:SAM-dependent methyltransferase
MSFEDHNFEAIALHYSKTVDQKSIHIYYERPNLISLLPSDLNNLKILDLGCGSGWYAEYLTNKGAHVTAIDNSPTMINLTKQRVQARCEVYLADLNNPLDFLENETFDIIIAPLVIHYIADWKVLFCELSKKLKSNGVFIFSTHNPYIEYQLFDLKNYFEKVKIVDEWENVGKVEFYHHTLHELSEAINIADLVIERMLEPQPLIEMKTVDLKLYTKLTSSPWFLFVKAIKKDRS